LATLSRLILTLEQTDAQRLLQVVRVSYDYTLTGSEVECERNISYEISVDLLGDDVLSDEVLASGVDTHIVECGGTNGAPIPMRRSLVVGQSLLNEDVGTDEIKLRIRATSDAGEEISLTSAIVRGRF
jgi:hypothetical protein